MASGKQGLFVVVWEWENKQRRWRPYPPEVTQQLERAHSKKLRSVLLGDSDPPLKNYCVHLPQMEQECRVSGERVKVRRNFYPQSSPAGQGAVWQWAGDAPGDWHVYDMCVQCIIEESWTTGAQTVDMSQTFPKCPYIINFCNLTQMNSRTRFIRGIRRVQQAAYPVGKPPLQQSHHGPGIIMANYSRSSSSNPFNNTSKVPAPPTGSSTAGDRSRRRGSRDDVDAPTSDVKPRTFINKFLGRGHGSSSNNSRGVTMSPPASNDMGDKWSGGSHWTGKADSPPKPLPRTSVPPVPKPRTSLPPPKQQHQPQHHQHQHLDDMQHNQRQHLLEDQEDHRMLMSRSFRNESSMGRYESNHTLDSDCSSLISSRRPSVDTISTYLSLESCVVEDDHNQNTRYQNLADAGAACSPVVDQLIRVDSDESMDDDVFGEDQEVCDVMRGAAENSCPTRASSPLTLSQPHHQHRPNHQMTNHHSTSHGAQNQSSSQQQCHFMPITAAQSGSDMGQQVNGVKRKRTGERTTPGYQHALSRDGHNGGTANHDSYFHACNNHHYNTHHKPQHGSRAPIAAEDQLLVEYTSVVESPPDEMCSICMWSLQEPSGYLEDDEEAAGSTSYTAGCRNDGVVSLVLCNHMFHLACVRQMAKTSPQFLECPNCKTLHGEKQGNQPNGDMSVTIVPASLPGHPECDTIKIIYCINNGVQGPEHPHPGQPFYALGFPRIAYLPNSEKGQKVLNLLKEAWQRRLVFTVGMSNTTGLENCVTWNEIHHKTEWQNYSGHGYPDPDYLDNTLKELALHGITETTLV